METVIKALEKIKDVELKYSWAKVYYSTVSLLCANKREDLEFYKKFYGTQKESPDPQTEEKMKGEMEAVNDLIKQAQHTPQGEQEVVLQEAKENIIHLLRKYPDLNLIYKFKSEEPDLWRKFYGLQMRSQQHGTGEVINKMKEVDELFMQIKHRPLETSAVEVKAELQQVEEKINKLELKCSEDSEYYDHVESFWKQKGRDLELYSKLGLLDLGFNLSNTEELMEKVVKTLNYLSLRTDQNRTLSPDLLIHMYTHMKASLNWINICCMTQRENLNKFKQQPSRGPTDKKMIHYMERHLMELEQWCMFKEHDLNIYYRKLISSGKIHNANPKPQHNKGGEDTALLEIKTEQK